MTDYGRFGSKSGHELSAPEQPRNGLTAVKKALLALGALALSVISGCFAAAAPLALNAARAVASGIARSAQTNRKANQEVQGPKPCEIAEHRSPEVIEIRTDNRGTAMYRSLNLSGPEEYRQTGHSSDQVGYPEEWRGIEGLSNMKFHPPIQDQLVPGTVIFLAYAPAHAHDPAELDQLDTLNNDFGPALGDFDWNNREYLYSVIHQLPCKSSDVPVLMQASGEHARHAEPTQPIGPQAPEQPH